MLPGETDELVHIGTDRLHSALHGGDGIALSLQPNPLSPDGPELQAGQPGSTSAVHARQVAAEYEYLPGPKLRDAVRCRSHSDAFCCKDTKKYNRRDRSISQQTSHYPVRRVLCTGSVLD